RARTPHANAAIGEVANAIDARWIEHALLGAREALRETDDGGQLAVGRRLEHAALRIVEAVQTGDVPGGRHVHLLAAEGIDHHEPRNVERGLIGYRLAGKPLRCAARRRWLRRLAGLAVTGRIHDARVGELLQIGDAFGPVEYRDDAGGF